MRLVLWLTLLLALSAGAIADEPLKYARIAYSPIQSVAERLLTVVYQRAGIEMEIVHLPAKRASFETATGSRDGEIMRIESYGADKTGLYRIPYPLGWVKTRLYVNNDHRDIELSDLNRYQLATVKGVRHSNEYAMGYPSVYQFNDVALLMKQLDRGKVDVAIVSQINADYEIAQHPRLNIAPLGDAVKVQGSYHYINQKHTATIDRVEYVMREMTESGELQTLWQQYVSELLIVTEFQ
jgi:hypothetical protein